MRDGFDVGAAGRAQRQPLGEQNGKPGLHGSLCELLASLESSPGLLRKKSKGGAGIPVSPISEPNWVRRFDWIPADLV